MDNVAVIFSDAGARILHGVNPDDFSGRTDVLINPIFPSGIPPHLWKISDGKIVTEVLPSLPNRFSLSPRLKSALIFLAGIAVGLLALLVK